MGKLRQAVLDHSAIMAGLGESYSALAQRSITLSLTPRRRIATSTAPDADSPKESVLVTQKTKSHGKFPQSNQTTPNDSKGKPRTLFQSTRVVLIGARAPRATRRTGHIGNYNFLEDHPYDIRGIMAESKNHYKIRWAGEDPDGNKWIDTWVPKDHADEGAKEDWEFRKSWGRQKEFDDRSEDPDQDSDVDSDEDSEGSSDED